MAKNIVPIVNLSSKLENSVSVVIAYLANTKEGQTTRNFDISTSAEAKRKNAGVQSDPDTFQPSFLPDSTRV